ncbi:hypothetical protein FAGAP_11437 [Fusarium agapanthi]|uniref:Uncharacterized protein n=1 Tax=Fusarium agapanthi TaxID=1803897 RepID=A0A9P5E8T3_9HYPO|nr:hypothetical protein FAGAP_11437 [Fusarium agapanthi]
MSTSSGESGSCLFCGHYLNEHTKASRSQCKKCKKRFYICQAPLHETAGWRICDIPCGCGSKYYPTTAKEARPLKPTEYASTHPLYESPPSNGEDTSYEAASSTSAAPATEPVYVTLKKNGDQFEFTYNNNKILTYARHWRPARLVYQGQEDDFWLTENDGVSYITWTLPTDNQEVQTQRSLGKRVAYPAQPSHERTLSNSTDPLQWDDERFEAETQMASRMAGLALGGGSSDQVQDDRVHVSARYHKKDKVEFKNEDGKTVYTLISSWVQVVDGFVFESKDYGKTYFTKKIKAAKK